MQFSLINGNDTARPLFKVVALVLFALSVFSYAPMAEAQCTVATDGTDFGSVIFEECTEAKNGGNTNVLTLAYPPGTTAGDLLITSIATDGNETFMANSGWERLIDIVSGGSNLAVLRRIADGTEPANETFTWGTNEEVIGVMMRFSGATGNIEFNTNTGSSNSPQAPDIVGVSFSNYTALRLGAYDDDDVTINPGTIMTGHQNINQDESGGGNGTSSGSAAYLAIPGGGDPGTANFSLTATEGWSTATLALEFGPTGPFPLPGAGCPRTDGSFIGSQRVVFQECTEAVEPGNVASVTVDTPSGEPGDYMIAVIAADNNETVTEPGGWNAIGELTNGVTLGVYEKFYEVGEAPNYTWNIGSTENFYSMIWLFTDASGLFQAGTATGNNAAPTAPSVNALEDNSLILRVVAADDDDLDRDPETIISGQTNISQDASDEGGGTVSSISSYVNQNSAGLTGTSAYSLLLTETWIAGTIALEPIEFRFDVGDGTASTCGAQLITLSVTDSAGTPIPDFNGLVTLSASNSASATWTDPGGLQGTLTDLTGGAATYQFDVDDDGVAVFEYHNPVAATVNFGLVYNENGPTFIEDPSFDANLVVDNLCEYRIALDDGTMGTCSSELITITVFDSEGVQATHYTGTIDITNDQNDGDYTVDTGGNPIVNGAPDDGAASYTFLLADAGQVILDFTDTTAATVNFNIVDTGNPTYLVDGGFDPNLTVGDCKIIISHSTESDVCSLEAITISVTDPMDNPITTFTGTITLSNSAGAGTWTVNTATNALVDNGGGSVNYTFDVLDAGSIILDFELNQTDAAVDFDATTLSPGIASPTGVDDPLLEVVACTAQISVAATANLCSPSETVTLTILNRDAGAPNGTIGTIVLSTDTGNGNFDSTDGSGVLDNGAPDDGIATYAFDPTDGNVINFEFSTDTVESLDFDASSTYITFDAAGSSETLNVLGCEFQISHSTTTDVCSIEQVTIEVRNTSDVLVTDYVGTVNLSTSTGNGTWALNTGGGSVVDPVAEDGSATYEFVGGDAGVVVLDFTDATNETVNINVSDGTTTDSNPAEDPNLAVDVCTFRITMVDEEMRACTSEDVTITVYDSSAAIATSYTGTVTLTTDTLNGTWSDAGGLNGTLTDSVADDGMATYEFDATDNGVATFTFTSTTVEDVNVNLVDGVIIEDSGFDPVLEVLGCIPAIQNSICFDGNSGGNGNGNLTIGAADPGRMVVMLIYHVNATPDTVANATFNGANMTLINSVASTNTAVEMWGILDANLPAGAGSYAGNYTFTGAENGASMCMVELSDVEQVFPTTDTPAQDGQTNTSTTLTGAGSLELETSITTIENNAMVISGGVSDFTFFPGASTFNDIDPDPPMDSVIIDGFTHNPQGGTAALSAGSKSIVGLFTVTDTDAQDAVTSGAHVVSAFNPRVPGDPEAEDFVPVLLFETLSGNISYRAIGNTMRTHSNQGTDDEAPFTAGGSCDFVPLGTGSSATLTMPSLPVTSTVERAYVYWAASGDDELGHTDDEVHFGPTGSEIAITADEVFLINNVAGGRDFFAAYKNVTSQVTANGSYTLFNLDVQNGAPWNTNSTCAGGWSLVVIYSHPNERFRVTNLFHGFQPFQNSAFTLVPRNFRMQTTDDDPLGFLPNGQITHVTIEGDETLATGDESLGIQDGPGLETFTTLFNSYNPLTADFNSTVSMPDYYLDGGTGFYEFDATGGDDGAGYLIFDAPGTPAPNELGNTWGFDVDTHYISGEQAGTVLYPFASAGSEAEEITTRYSSGQDLVMLISEVISVTNFDLADLEVFKATGGTFTVDSTSTYEFTVTNNGNGGSSGGEATGQVVVADVFPTGITLDSMSGDDWSCTTSASAFYCVYDIAVDCDFAAGCETTDFELHEAESLPLLTANVSIGDTSFFPLLSNNVENVARMQHNGGSCPAPVAGVIADPDDCDRAPQFDNVNDLQGGAVDINDIDEKTPENNNVDDIIHEVRGVETDLGITKVVDGILEVGETGSYTITVTNTGPDDTTGGAGGTITVNDTEPAGVTFDSVSGAGWTCSGGGSDEFPCTYGGTLAAGFSAVLTLNVTVTGAAGENVTNTASVSSGTFNFDTNSSNDADTDITAIVAPPVASNERFLISVSVPSNSTDIGGLTGFENHDYIDYNPLTDTGLMFYDNSGEGYSVSDADAVHLFKNGHIAISAAASSTIGSNVLAFEPEDIVVWDPILETATLLFDGSVIFDDAGENIDAVYVKENGNIVFSTEGPASISWPGPNTLNFNQGDIVEYDPSDGSATILVDSSDADIFNGEVQVDSIYIRVDDSDPDANKEVYILSINEVSDTIGVCGSCDPSGGTTLTRDDIVELDITGANPITQNLFVGDVPLGVFETADVDRTIDAIHVVEDGYFGHFAITQSQAGSTCEAGQITITKHAGLSHDPETSYVGTILITTDIGEGDWSLSVGSGTLDNGAADDGAAQYTFAPADNGTVTLFLSESDPSTINVNVSNEFIGELGSEDPNFVFNDVITNVTYRDEWESIAYDNNDGTTSWATDWVETDGLGGGAASGNISAPSGQLEITSTGADPTPSILREIDFGSFGVTETVFLNYDFSYEFLNSGSDVLEIRARESSGDGFEVVRTFSGIGGSDLTPNAESLDLDSLIPGFTAWGDGAAIQFRVTGGYTGTSRMFFDNIEVATGTTDCGVGDALNTYEIRIDGTTGNSATLVPGIACIGSVIRVTALNLTEDPIAPNESITLTTSTSKGDWTLMTGSGVLNNGTLGDGIATYTFPPLETFVEFIFNYTDPATDPESVNINVAGSVSEAPATDPTLQVNDAGLLFYNEDFDTPTSVNPIPTQISGKPSNELPNISLITIEGVQTSDIDNSCTPLFDAGNTLSIGFAAECLNPGTCSTAPASDFAVYDDTLTPIVMTPAPDNSGPGTSASYVTVDLLMENQGSGRVAGDVIFSYADAGQIEIHAQYEVPLGNNIAGISSTDFIVGSSTPFVVRPFGFDIDFSGDRAANGHVDAAVSYSTDATDANFLGTAGVGFDTTVSAIAWQAADDTNDDGIPDQGANLYDNAVTQNFGNETTAGTYEVLITHSLVQPVGGEPGVLTDNTFSAAGFASGFQTHTMTYDEVGVIDLTATLVLNGTSTPANYLNVEGLVGNVENVGRFVPADFQLSSGVINSRPLASARSLSISPSTFTYLGEEFEVMATVTARNASGATTRNYVFDATAALDFAKLTGTDFDIGSFFAADEIGAPTDYTARLADPSGGANRNIDWAELSDAVVDRGIGTLTGNLIFERQASGAEDGPFDSSLSPGTGTGKDSISIAVAATDSDSVGFVFDLDIDGGGNDAAKIAEEEFRYGRLLIDNSFGPESEELGIGFSIEYWNGTEFVLNTDDSTTTLFLDNSEAVGTRSLSWVTGSFEDDLTEDTDDVAALGESIVESGTAGTTDVEISVFEGRTAELSDVDSDADEFDDDRPFFASAPDPDSIGGAPDNEGLSGSGIIEFDLSDAQLPFSLDFLSYDWRGVGDIEDENEDGDYSDNPRGRLTFGSYQGHDRVINWQEIYIGPD